MSLFLGTRSGVYRTATPHAEDVTHVLDSGNTPRVRTVPAVDGVFAASASGLYRSTDDGQTWDRLAVPREEVYSVVAGPDGERLYAGTHPAHLYVSSDGGETWTELDGFQELPSRDEWHTPRHRNEAHVRGLGVAPEISDRVIAGVEVGGVHVSDDRGETWAERCGGSSASGTSGGSPREGRSDGVSASEASGGSSREKRSDGVHDDVHHVLVLGADEYIASTGDGLYRTRDAGRSWTRLDTGIDHRYFREAFALDGRLYAAAAHGPPGTWSGTNGANAVLLESVDDGETWERVSYPGGPEEVVLGWTEFDERVVAGTNDGSLIRRGADGTWTETGAVPAEIRSLAVC
ncbi:glycosyl hydrolase [Halobacteriales archaeon SW_8_65_20]|nr:MAG: glycosyl hydrolase [Halobacteriales archaeon SW_8_65_20]